MKTHLQDWESGVGTPERDDRRRQQFKTTRNSFDGTTTNSPNDESAHTGETMSESNLPFRRRTVLKATGVAGVTGGTLAGLGSASEDCTVTIDGPEGWNSMSLKKQLKEVENETKSYRKPENADADGYKNTGLLGCRHGFSYGKDDSFDKEVDPLNPDIITYLLTNKKLELGAVEYVVPADCGEPDLFNDEGEEEKERWDKFGENQSLHVWVHEDNPDGVFAPRNPGFNDMPGCVDIPDP